MTRSKIQLKINDEFIDEDTLDWYHDARNATERRNRLNGQTQENASQDREKKST